MIARIFPILLSVLLCSCASVSVKKAEPLAKVPPTRVPEKIFVEPFSFYDPGIRVDRSGAALDKFKYDLQERFTRHLVKRLSEQVAPAEAVAATAPLPRGNYWLVTGRFDRINQGSRALRAVVGFGTGATKLETSVVIYDLSKKRRRPVLLIETTGGSNVSPGALGTAGYFVNGVTSLGSVVNLLEGVRTGVTFDVIRTTREVSATTAEYLHQEGLLAENKHKPKKLGELPYSWWPFNPKPAKKGTISVTPAE